MPRQPNRRLVLFCSCPRAGSAKPRLIPELGADGAASVAAGLAGRAVLTARVAAAELGLPLEIHYRDGAARAMRHWLGRASVLRAQAAGDQGRRLAAAAAAAAAEPVIIGSDCPGLTPAILAEACRSLDRREVVLGPASDGGYYLIGLRRPEPALFTGIEWGSETVLRRTLAAVEQAGLTVHWLPPLAVVDRPGDLPAWRAMRPVRLDEAPTAGISVVMLSRDGADGIEAAVSAAAAEADEVLVVGDGRNARLREAATNAGGRVVPAAGCAAQRLNAGAQAARQPLLLLLPPATGLPAGFAAAARACLRRPRTSAVAIPLRGAGEGCGGQWFRGGPGWRGCLAGLCGAEHAVLVPRSLFDCLGGCAAASSEAALDLTARLRRWGKVRWLSRPAVRAGSAR